MIPQLRAVEFLDLLHFMNATDEELKMADNYFSILSNTFTETWFDQGVELGGGQPFTVGLEGNERNKRHIIRAFEILESITECQNTPCLPSGSLPYVNIEQQLDPVHVSRAPCIGSVCLLETSIDLLSDAVKPWTRTDHNILAHEAANAKLMGQARRDHYLNYPPSHAVDGRPDTAFCSFQEAREGDTISLDLLLPPPSEWTRIEFVFLVELATEEILRASIFEAAAGGRWVASHQDFVCMNSEVQSPYSDASIFLRECHVQMWPMNLERSAHSVRARLSKTMDKPWCIFEVWLRGSRIRSSYGMMFGTLWDLL